MDAHAHLLSLGWAGPGHSLDSRPHQGRRGVAYDPKQAQNNGNGLIKPLLISQKKNTFGVGKKAHEPAAGNQWWLKGFETALSNVGKSESERTSGTATPELGRSTNGYTGKHVGLYRFFVKGGEMEGTIGLNAREEKPSKMRKKRKSDALDTHGESSASSEGEERPTERRTRNKRQSAEGTEEFEQIGAFLQARDKDEKRRRRKQKADALVEFRHASEFFEARSARRKTSLSDCAHIDTSKTVDLKAETTDDTEDRRRRRRERKAAKAANAMHAASDGENISDQATANLEDDQRLEKKVDDASIARAAHKSKKKRRKELEQK